MSRYAAALSPRTTPQTEPVIGKPMVANSAGGYTFAVDCWKRMERFLILGAEGGTYYIGERKLVQENAKCVLECGNADPKRAVDMIVSVSTGGRAPKNEPAVFALALLAGQSGNPVSHLALAALPEVCRIGTHLFQFVGDLQTFRGWGPAARRAVANWYKGRSVESLALQCTKYQNRNGFTHRDVLRLCHLKGATPEQNLVIRWSLNKEINLQEYEGTPAACIVGVESIKQAQNARAVAEIISSYDLPRESVPTQWLNEKCVWEALLRKMPITAMIRSLGKMASIGLTSPLSDASRKVVETITNPEILQKGRVHPLQILTALRIYQQGRGEKGSLTWTPDKAIVAALDKAFYLAFKAVEPTGKRHLFGIDVSGSMASPFGGGSITSCEVAAALAMFGQRCEPWSVSYGFTDRFVDLGITANMTLKEAMAAAQRENFGRTDCAVPMVYAAQHKIPVDVFVVITDNETYAGRVHPFQALKAYREQMGIPAKMIVVATASNGFTIADPSDAGMLDICGMDSSVPAVMADFCEGLIGLTF